VDVDEAGTDGQPRDVYHLARRSLSERTERGDAAVLDGDVSQELGIAGAVQHPTASKE
jgi:hypothetical protein